MPKGHPKDPEQYRARQEAARLRNPRAPFRHTEESKAKMRASTLGQPHPPMSDETRAKLREIRLANNPMKGSKHTEETRAKMRAATNPQHAKGEEAVNWKGGRVLDRRGYVLIYMPEHPNAIGNYVFEHRLVMEETIGRLLERDELVHHMNHDKADNRPENLMIMSRGEHSRHHRLIEPFSVWKRHKLNTESTD